MANIALSLPQSDTDIDAGPVADNFSQIQAAINGGLDASNLAPGTIPTVPPIPQIAKGSSFIHFSQAETADALTITHGLGAIPTSVILQIGTASGGVSPVNGGADLVIWPFNLTATTFDVGGAITNSVTYLGSWAFYWIAL